MGRAAAECFAADGAVAVMARGRGALDETVARLTELGSPDAVGLSVDVGHATSIINGFAELGERWGELNSLVCAVGPEVSQLPWDQVSDEQFVDAFVIGALSAVRSARSQGFGLIEYAAAKAALTSITKNLSLELAAEGILANTVSPGTYLGVLRRACRSRPRGHSVRHRTGDLLPGLRTQRVHHRSQRQRGRWVKLLRVIELRTVAVYCHKSWQAA
ncbi:NAD(P)-dependent dehydrogenase (short-subunit alcohol dehydrogenase family) [Mycobacterium sp. AZCC_0083]|nr:NAD(P)-dependent dehydrogenase (short-subunit alcohol dehydrogenase family) [Mycobacterium sp. AZCC_0083]